MSAIDTMRQDAVLCAHICTRIGEALGHDAAGLPWLCEAFAAHPMRQGIRALSGPLSASTVTSRCFREGVHIGRLVDETQLLRVRGLLENENALVTDVAHALQWSSSQALCRFVRRMTGMTPMTWRLTAPNADALLTAMLQRYVVHRRDLWQWFDPLMSPAAYKLAHVRLRLASERAGAA